MGRTPISLLRRRFGSLTVISLVERNKYQNTKWRCECDCGAKVDVFYQNLVTGRTKSGGCGIKPAAEI